MNIKQAKIEIKQAIQAYLSKDAFGEYRIPIVKQRPILLIGAPGIGKTAIMEQVQGNVNWTCFLYDDTSYKANGNWASIY